MWPFPRLPRKLVLFFPHGPNVHKPEEGCRCGRNPPQRGSALTCAVCHASGLDGHPAFEWDSRIDPARDPRPLDRTKPATRRQLRKRRFASRNEARS